FGTPAMAGDSVPFEVTIRMRPGRSVTSTRLLDRKAIAHGCSNPCAMVSTTISPADELNVCATVGLAQGKNVQLATQIALNVVVIGNLMLPHAPRIAFTRHHRCLGDGRELRRESGRPDRKISNWRGAVSGCRNNRGTRRSSSFTPASRHGSAR